MYQCPGKDKDGKRYDWCDNGCTHGKPHKWLDYKCQADGGDGECPECEERG